MPDFIKGIKCYLQYIPSKSVIDKGPGIAEDKIALLLERYLKITEIHKKKHQVGHQQVL